PPEPDYPREGGDPATRRHLLRAADALGEHLARRARVRGGGLAGAAGGGRAHDGRERDARRLLPLARRRGDPQGARRRQERPHRVAAEGYGTPPLPTDGQIADARGAAAALRAALADGPLYFAEILRRLPHVEYPALVEALGQMDKRGEVALDKQGRLRLGPEE